MSLSSEFSRISWQGKAEGRWKERERGWEGRERGEYEEARPREDGTGNKGMERRLETGRGKSLGGETREERKDDIREKGRERTWD